ncbi:endonuclease/exonuclease/phosphatase family protein [Ornithinimicrobium faecis]|uniref:Endonuclease/exonuclease/phosphatase family protein n=1 Tax=Ornithinimicrobium faecis TaxID=2934158 RepID=A0ABY4YY21_9MICO|nr:endonuclease/exonuclease/phosphatase family protein [Ornithinimicrobium sp. HY1793]USQ81673.1 endonuclease/exonuclease/phosphatase family protein [Ornithinimicrobium sp. HY1793]
MSSRIRVASYNLRGLKDDPAAAAEVVRRIDPDVLLLQEVPRHPFSGWRIARFARSCGLLWSGRTRRLSGTGMLTSSRLESTDSVDKKLPVAPRANPRSYTAAQVRVPGGQDITVASIHLSLLADERLRHATLVLEELAANPLLADGPFVIGGDLNESSQGKAWRVLGERLTLASPDRPTFPSAGPKSWIDAIFASPELTVSSHQDVTLERELVSAATDHLPVWIDLEIAQGGDPAIEDTTPAG